MNDGRTDATGAEDGGTVVESPGIYRRLNDARGDESTVIGLTIVAVLIFPFLLIHAPITSDILQGYSGLASLILIWTIFAIGFDLLLGYTGLLSFGHAAFWGGAAYAAGVFSATVSGQPLLMVLVGTTFAVLLAWLLGFLSLRRGGIYFSILTLAFGQMMFYMAASPLSFVTNGENGFTSVAVADFLGVIPLSAHLPGVFGFFLGEWLYVFVGFFAVLAVAVAYRILNSPYGLVFRAIRENEQRVEFVGLNVWRYRLMAFVISGAFAGVAGSLFAIHGQYVPLHSLHWTTSGEIVVMTVLGGAGSLFGPILGVAAYQWSEVILSSFPTIGAYWHLLLGLLFVAVVALVPDGLLGILKRMWWFLSLLVRDPGAAASHVRARIVGFLAWIVGGLTNLVTAPIRLFALVTGGDR